MQKQDTPNGRFPTEYIDRRSVLQHGFGLGAAWLVSSNSVGSVAAESGTTDSIDVWQNFGSGALNRHYRPEISAPVLDLQQAWQFEVDGSGLVTPPVFDTDCVYVGNRPSDSDNSALYALDRATGEEQWRFETDRPVGGTAALANELVYFGTGDPHLEDGGLVLAVDPTSGEKVWEFTQGHLQGPPLATDSRIYTAVDGSIMALDADTGDQIWETSLAYATFGSFGQAPAVTNEEVLITNGSDLLAFSPEDGSQRWDFSPSALDFQETSPAIDDGTIYIGGRSREESYAAAVVAVEAATGEEIWRYTIEDDDSEPWIRGLSAVGEDAVYANLVEGTTISIDRDTGEKVWELDMPARSGDTAAQPVATGDVIVTGHYAEEAELLLLEQDSGNRMVADTEVLPSWARIWGPPAVGEETIYVSTATGTVHAFDGSSGSGSTNQATSKESEQEQADTENKESTDSTPGFGIGSGIAALGGIGYMLKRQLTDDSQ